MFGSQEAPTFDGAAWGVAGEGDPPGPAPPPSRLAGGRDPHYAQVAGPSQRGDHDGFPAGPHDRPGTQPPRRAARR